MFSSIAPLALTSAALAFATALSKVTDARLKVYRYREIEGLRGLLAFWVFVHHAYVWRTYAISGQWVAPDSHLFAHLGKSSVGMFFMITAFLFTDRLMDTSKSIEWRDFAIARVMRLYPAYALAAATVLLLVAVQSGFERHDSLLLVLRHSVQWLSLGVLGTPDVNQVANTGLMIAWVTWSLPFEVLFYLALPIAGIVFARRPSLALGGACVVGIAFILSRGLEASWLLAFLPGIATAVMARYGSFRGVVRNGLFAATCGACVATGVWRSGSFFDPFTFFGLSGLFASIASGNSLFGLLRARGADFLGQVSYSVYLFHGLVFFVAMRLVVGQLTVGRLGDGEYWLLVAGLVPVIITISFLVYRWIEAPGITAGRNIIGNLRRRNSKVVEPADVEISEPAT